MPYVMVDVEADGPIPGDYSMVSFGAIIVEPELNRTFYGLEAFVLMAACDPLTYFVNCKRWIEMPER